MTTVAEDNVWAVEVAGTFDDCQSLVKQAFAEVGVAAEELVAVNSINWGRVAAQIVYYAWAAARTDDAPDVAVPTGNFGNVFAGWCAKQMGVPLHHLLVANNRNHLTSDLLVSGRMEPEPVTPTVAPAMDVGLPSNLERYLFEVAGRNPERLEAIRQSRSVGATELGAMREDLRGGWAADEAALSTIRDVFEHDGLLIDPHTAIAWQVGRRLRSPGRPLVVLATADVAKFGPAVEAAIGREPPVREEVAALLAKPERVTRIDPLMVELRPLLRSATDGFA
jgi:threonine synthase